MFELANQTVAGKLYFLCEHDCQIQMLWKKPDTWIAEHLNGIHYSEFLFELQDLYTIMIQVDCFVNLFLLLKM